MNARVNTPHRGFVMLLAILVLAFVGAAIAALAATMSFDGRRTVDQIRNAQLEQMLLAAAGDAASHLGENAPAVAQSWLTDLPSSLNDRGATLETSVGSASTDGSITLHIQARLEDRSAEQTIRLSRGANGWKLAAAERGDAGF